MLNTDRYTEREDSQDGLVIQKRSGTKEQTIIALPIDYTRAIL